MTKTLYDCIGESAAFLEGKGVDSPLLSAEILACHVLGLDRTGLLTQKRRELVSKEVEAIRALVARRGNGEPVAYITGHKEFYGLDFKVGPGVLIPRPETEHIVEKVEELFDSAAPLAFADLGTGSGILGVTLATLFPQSRGLLLDISVGALEFAAANAEMHGVRERLELRQGSMLEPFSESESLDLVVSNPPYVSAGEYEGLDREVAAFEPAGALVSGEDGLDHLRGLLPHVADALKQGGVVLVEIGWRQGAAAKKITEEYSRDFEEIAVLTDLAGHDRVLFATKRNCKKTTH